MIDSILRRLGADTSQARIYYRRLQGDVEGWTVVVSYADAEGREHKLVGMGPTLYSACLRCQSETIRKVVGT